MGVIRLGMHLELVKSGLKLDSPEAIDNKYASSVHDIVTDSCIIVTNPTLRARLIPMHSGERYDAYFFTKENKIFTCRVTVDKNSTDNGIRVVRLNLTSSVEKYERRQFFRLETVRPLRYLLLTAQNSADFKQAVKSNTLLQMNGFHDGTTLDISGGGVRFTSDEILPVGGMAIVHLEIKSESVNKNYIFVAKILLSKKHESIRGLFEHRSQFVDLKQDAREELVQFIFQCEREHLKKRH